jgi:hypothetical protein
LTADGKAFKVFASKLECLRCGKACAKVEKPQGGGGSKGGK